MFGLEGESRRPAAGVRGRRGRSARTRHRNVRGPRHLVQQALAGEPLDELGQRAVSDGVQVLLSLPDDLADQGQAESVLELGISRSVTSASVSAVRVTSSDLSPAGVCCTAVTWSSARLEDTDRTGCCPTCHRSRVCTRTGPGRYSPPGGRAGHARSSEAGRSDVGETTPELQATNAVERLNHRLRAGSTADTGWGRTRT